MQARKATTKQEDAEDTSESSTNPDEETMQQFEDLFAAIMTATDPADNNRPLHTMFQLKPSKKVRKILTGEVLMNHCFKQIYYINNFFSVISRIL